MDIAAKRRFLLISNIVISVLCAVSILGFFIMPLWRMDFSVTLTEDLANAVMNRMPAYNGTSSAATPVYRRTGGASVDLTQIPADFAREVLGSGLVLRFSSSVSTADVIASIYYKDTARAEKAIDRVINELADGAEEAIDAVLIAAAKAAAKVMVKANVEQIASDGEKTESFEQIMDSLGVKKEEAESLIDTIINAIMAPDATVDSVTKTVMECADDAQEILAGTEKYKDAAGSYDAEARENLKQTTESFLRGFADESGNLRVKDVIVDMLNEAIDKFLDPDLAGTLSASPIKTNDALREGQNKKSVTETLKEKAGDLVYNAGGGIIPKMTVAAMAVCGALVLIVFFFLFYPILKTVLNVKAENPGFSLFMPIAGGIVPYLFTVLLPSFFPAVFKGIAQAGKAMSIQGDIIEAYNAVSLRLSSGSVIAFIVACALLIFSFFYAHHRRALKKALAQDEI